MPTLICPTCHAALETTPDGARCTACAAEFPLVDGMPSFLPAAPEGVEQDYAWDYRSDPRISALTVTRWRLMTRLIDRVDVGRVVVAVGGGGEHWPARQLSGRVSEYVVVDTSAAQLARQWFPGGARGTAVLAAAERLPLAGDSADTVELWGVLDHVVDAEAAIAEAARVVRPGGKIIIGLGNDGSWYRRFAGRLGPSDSHAHRRRFDRRAIADLVSPHFQITSVDTLAYLRLPIRIERALGRRIGARAQEQFVEVTDAALRRVFGPDAGGMIFVVARAATGGADR